MVEVGGTPDKTGRGTTKTAHAGGDAKDLPKYHGRPEKERIWLALTRDQLGERAAAKLAGVSRWKVRNCKAGWVAQGWMKQRKGGGVVVTDKAPKKLRKGWADPPVGSPQAPPMPKAQQVGDAARVHRGKLKAHLDRRVDVGSLDWWEGAKARSNGVIYHRFVLPCKTKAGLVGVPVQVIQPRRTDRPFLVMIQSANVMAQEATLLDLGREGTMAWVLEAMTELVRQWLGDHADAVGPLKWVGLDKEDMEVAIQAHADAPVGGQVQRDFVAVDKSDRYTPFDKEEEQTLTAFVKLRKLDRDVSLLKEGQDRIIAVLEQVVPSVTEQLDGLAAAIEALVSRQNGGLKK